MLGFTSDLAQAPEYLPLRQFISRKRSPGFLGYDRNLVRFGDNWLMPYKIFQKRGFSGFPYEDNDILIPCKFLFQFSKGTYGRIFRFFLILVDFFIDWIFVENRLKTFAQLSNIKIIFSDEERKTTWTSKIRKEKRRNDRPHPPATYGILQTLSWSSWWCQFQLLKSYIFKRSPYCKPTSRLIWFIISLCFDRFSYIGNHNSYHVL